MTQIALISGGFDPLHIGHLRLIQAARKYGQVHVLLNSDAWIRRTTGEPFLLYADRYEILNSLEPVWTVHPALDMDGTVRTGIAQIKKNYPDSKITFCTRDDKANTPEAFYCDHNDIEIIKIEDDEGMTE